MTDLVITAANCVRGDGANVEQGTAGATITAGQVVYLASATNRYGLADSNSATAEVRAVRGIALNGASNGQPLAIIRSGPLTLGATMTAGVAYYLSDTPGGICAVADLATGEYPTILGIATSTTILNVKIQAAGVAL